MKDFLITNAFLILALSATTFSLLCQWHLHNKAKKLSEINLTEYSRFLYFFNIWKEGQKKEKNRNNSLSLSLGQEVIFDSSCPSFYACDFFSHSPQTSTTR
jgi:hypothetical protein